MNTRRLCYLVALGAALGCELVGGIESRRLTPPVGKILATGGTANVGQSGEGGADNSGGDGGSPACDTPDAGSEKLVPVALAAGRFHTCAVFDTGHLKCWGQNDTGALGLGHQRTIGDEPCEMGDNLPVVNLDGLVGLDAIRPLAAGGRHTCVILDSGKIKCWGDNAHGQLGLGNDETRGIGSLDMGSLLPPVELGGDYRALAVVAGDYHTCALLEEGAVKCWGWNMNAQLGRGTTEDAIGDQGAEMGEFLSPVDLGSTATIDLTARTPIAAGSFHNCVQLDDARIKCWGSNDYGQLGLGDKITRGYSFDEMGDALQPVDLGPSGQVVDMALGYWHSCVLLDDSRYACWGANGSGQLGINSTEQRGDDADEMGLALRSGLATPDLNVRPELVASGRLTSCVTLTSSGVNNPLNGRLKCWGFNDHGELGLGDTVARSDGTDPAGQVEAQPAVPVDGAVVQVVAASNHTCALLAGGRVKCWGWGQWLGLDIGVGNLGDEPGEIEALPDVDLGTTASLYD